MSIGCSSQGLSLGVSSGLLYLLQGLGFRLRLFRWSFLHGSSLLSQATPKEDLESGSDSVHADLEVFREKGSQGFRVRTRTPVNMFKKDEAQAHSSLREATSK